MKYFWLLLLITLPATSTSHFEEVGPLTSSHPLCHESPITLAEKTYGDFRIRISSAGDQSCQTLDILKGTTLIYHDEVIGGYFYFGDDFGNERMVWLDLAGNGSTNLVLSKWTGGMHCCYSLHILELGQNFRTVAQVDGGNFPPHLEDINEDGVPEIKVTDDFLAYQFSSFAYSATAEVILEYRNGVYVVDADAMEKPAPDSYLLNKKMISWQKDFRQRDVGDYPPPEFIQTLTDLFYTGNKDLALDLINQAWPEDIPGKADFLQSYGDSLKESQFYSEFERNLR